MSYLALVDAFSDSPFRGNPAAVCLTKRSLDIEVMQSIAAEMNVSETAFLYSIRDEEYSLRWFTPKVEVPLCGHATMAAAHILHAREGMSNMITFHTQSGELKAHLLTKGGIEVDFPTIPTQQLKEGTWNEPLELKIVSPPLLSGTNLLLEVEPDTLLNYNPDLSTIQTLEYTGIILTSRSQNKKYDFLTRYFAPKLGINEDPVTGSIHCSLSEYWSQKLKRDELTAYQASKRGGVLQIKYRKDRTTLIGKCTTIFQGELLVG